MGRAKRSTTTEVLFVPCSKPEADSPSDVILRWLNNRVPLDEARRAVESLRRHAKLMRGDFEVLFKYRRYSKELFPDGFDPGDLLDQLAALGVKFEWKPPPKKRGAPVRRTAEDNANLISRYRACDRWERALHSRRLKQADFVRCEAALALEGKLGRKPKQRELEDPKHKARIKTAQNQLSIALRAEIEPIKTSR